jgi:hypothetical protein
MSNDHFVFVFVFVFLTTVAVADSSSSSSSWSSLSLFGNSILGTILVHPRRNIIPFARMFTFVYDIARARRVVVVVAAAIVISE